jgi:glycosyltransferase involved in cell wall biosynthesis
MVVGGAPRRPRLLVDVTQFVSWPAASGVQRVLRHLADEWRGDEIEGLYGFIRDGRFVTGPISALGSEIASVFRTSSTGAPASTEDVELALTDTSEWSVSADDVEQAVDGYLLPEPTLRTDSLELAARLHGSTGAIPFFIYYDLLPLTHPQFFAPRSDGGLVVTRYHWTLARAANVAFISEAVRKDFESRIARRAVLNGIVARPGADGLGRAVSAAPARPSFVTIGTVEPRKRHRLMLEALERLWAADRDFRLVILGTAGGEDPELIDRLRQLSATERLTWIERPDDDDVANELSRASAILFPSGGEGYGLPPLEALAVGCPVIAVEDLPALEGLPSDGQIRLRTPTVEALVTAVETLADPTSNAAYRRDIANLQLPTWQRFTADVERWIAAALTHADRSDSNTPTGVPGQ